MVDAPHAEGYLSGVSSEPELLSPVRQATLRAAAERLVPHAFLDSPRGDTLTAALVQRVLRLPPDMRSRLETALDLLGNRWATLATGHHPLPFHLLAAEEQSRLLDRWLRSRVAALRTVGQAIRRLVMLVEYATPQSHEEVGYRGPYHQREAGLSWEGPLGVDRPGDDPVAYRDAGPTPAPASARLSTVLRGDAPTLSAEIVIVGSGAGGSTAAAVLAEAGHDVLLLEAGSEYGTADLDERESASERLYADAGLRATEDLSVSLMQGAALGGGTLVNWMIMLRTPDWVLAEWQERHGTEGMSARELSPVFDRVEHDLHARAVPDVAHSPNNRLLLDGARALGWSASAVSINARNCRRTGFCGHGCRYGAKQDAQHVYLPRARAAGARIYTGATAERVEVMERGGPFPLKRVHVRTRVDGAAATGVIVEAPVVILSAGAVETPVLLQRSGLGGGGVGRFLRLHPTTVVAGIADHEIQAGAGIPLSAMCDEHVRADENGYGFWLECPPLHPALAAAALPGFGSSHRELMLRYPHMTALIALVRDGADLGTSSGDVTLGRGGRVRIRYRLSERDARHLAHAIEAAARLQLAAGVREVRTLHTQPVLVRGEKDLARIRECSVGPNDVALFSAHVNGTCRIGSDRATSGTDPNGERWDTPGVFVADGSLLPTAPGVNPQETIIAIATVVAERIAARRRPG